MNNRQLGRLEAEMLRITREYYHREIERAIDNAQRSKLDKWFRREWYRAARGCRRGKGHSPIGRTTIRRSPAIRTESGLPQESR